MALTTTITLFFVLLKAIMIIYCVKKVKIILKIIKNGFCLVVNVGQ